MKRNFLKVDHQFDVWHLSKAITKKLTGKAEKKEFADLSLSLSLSLDLIHLKPSLVVCQNMWGRHRDVEREVDIHCLLHC